MGGAELSAADAEQAAQSYQEDGFAVLPGFASAEQCEQMMGRMDDLIREWDPSASLSVFHTKGDQRDAQGSDDYFLSSGDKVRFFVEPVALEDPVGLEALRTGDHAAKCAALNKAGHGLHVHEPVFRDYAQSPNVKRLMTALGYQAPSLPQSMYIFKQPEIGGEVTSHQDSTFLHTSPRLSCVGLWLALQDATLTNGCLWARRGSHKEPLRRRFCREGDPPAMTFEEEPTEGEVGAAAQWEGSLPQGGDIAAYGFEAVEVKQGTLVAIHGQVDHLSLHNSSPDSRHTFQLHLVEGPAAGVTWSESNWLQYADGAPFPSLQL